MHTNRRLYLDAEDLDKDGQEDLYTLVVTVYRSGWYVLVYVLCMVALGYHLLHGFF